MNIILITNDKSKNPHFIVCLFKEKNQFVFGLLLS
jgi:hypothetical protein